MSGEVYAVAVMSAQGSTGEDPRAQRIEEAMVAAAEQAIASGVTDPAQIRERMLSARNAIMTE